MNLWRKYKGKFKEKDVVGSGEKGPGHRVVTETVEEMQRGSLEEDVLVKKGEEWL